jgi:hypothetical protein
MEVSMKRIAVAASMILGMMALPAAASDPTGIYAVVDRVVLEPSAEAPERAQVWGTFVIARPRAGGSQYGPPEKGYMYFSLRPGKEDLTRREWADFKKVAGTGQVVGFGSRWEKGGLARLRKAAEKVGAPDVQPVSMGTVRLRTETEYAPIKALVEKSRE